MKVTLKENLTWQYFVWKESHGGVTSTKNWISLTSSGSRTKTYFCHKDQNLDQEYITTTPSKIISTSPIFHMNSTTTIGLKNETPMIDNLQWTHQRRSSSGWESGHSEKGAGRLGQVYDRCITLLWDSRIMKGSSFSWLWHLWKARSLSQWQQSMGIADMIGTTNLLPLYDILIVTSFEANQYMYIEGCWATHQIDMGHGSYIMHSMKFPSFINCKVEGPRQVHLGWGVGSTSSS